MRFTTVLGAVMALGALAVEAQTPSLSNDLQRAKAREIASGDCKSVLPEYMRIAEQGAKTDRASAAEALLRVGRCQQRIGDDDQAIATYRRLVADFHEQTPFVEDARRLLAPATSSPSASSASGTRAPFKQGVPDLRFGVNGIRSKDGLRVFEERNGSLIEVGEGGTEKVLVRREQDGVVLWGPAISPDDKGIAYRWRLPNRTEIRILDRSSNKTKTVFESTEIMRDLKWPSASRLVFSKYVESTDKFFALDMDSGVSRHLVDFENSRGQTGNFTPDGRMFIIVRDERLALVDLASGKQQFISLAVGASAPQFSPDGHLVAYIGRRDGNQELNVALFDGKQLTAAVPVVPVTGIAGSLVLRWASATSIDLFYQDYRRRLFRADVDPATMTALGRPAVLTLDGEGCDQPVVSRDGSELVCRVYPESTEGGLALMSTAGGRMRRFGPRDAGLQVYGWTSTDTVLVRVSRAGSSTLETINVRTGIATADSGTTAGVAAAQFVPATSELFFLTGAGSDSQLKARSADGIERTVLTGRLESFSVSSDGRQLVVTVRSDGRQESRRQVEVRLFKLDAEGATMPRVVATGVFSASFTPDAKHLVLIGETPRILRLEDGSSSPLLDLEKSQLVDRDTEAWFGGYSFVQFAPDRSFVVFGMDTQRAARMTFDGVTYEAVKKLTKMGGQR